MNDARLPEIGDEVFDVGRADLSERAIAEVGEERLQAVINRVRQCEPIRDRMALLVHGGQLTERQRATLG
jgi:hypothetical protein